MGYRPPPAPPNPSRIEVVSDLAWLEKWSYHPVRTILGILAPICMIVGLQKLLTDQPNGWLSIGIGCAVTLALVTELVAKPRLSKSRPRPRPSMMEEARIAYLADEIDIEAFEALVEQSLVSEQLKRQARAEEIGSGWPRTSRDR